MSEVIEQVTPEMIVKGIADHPVSSVCPECKEDAGRIGITSLVYVYEPCDCSEASYTHLVPVIYHRKCFLIKLMNEGESPSP